MSSIDGVNETEPEWNSEAIQNDMQPCLRCRTRIRVFVPPHITHVTITLDLLLRVSTERYTKR
jgi:hypothetical protein